MNQKKAGFVLPTNHRLGNCTQIYLCTLFQQNWKILSAFQHRFWRNESKITLKFNNIQTVKYFNPMIYLHFENLKRKFTISPILLQSMISP